jgi:hypothetical protein
MLHSPNFSHDTIEAVGFEIFTLATVKNSIFWDMLLCCLVGVSEEHTSFNFRVEEPSKYERKLSTEHELMCSI